MPFRLGRRFESVLIDNHIPPLTSTRLAAGDLCDAPVGKLKSIRRTRRYVLHHPR